MEMAEVMETTREQWFALHGCFKNGKKIKDKKKYQGASSHIPWF